MSEKNIYDADLTYIERSLSSLEQGFNNVSDQVVDCLFDEKSFMWMHAGKSLLYAVRFELIFETELT